MRRVRRCVSPLQTPLYTWTLLRRHQLPHCRWRSRASCSEGWRTPQTLWGLPGYTCGVAAKLFLYEDKATPLSGLGWTRVEGGRRISKRSLKFGRIINQGKYSPKSENTITREGRITSRDRFPIQAPAPARFHIPNSGTLQLDPSSENRYSVLRTYRHSWGRLLRQQEDGEGGRGDRCRP